MLTQGKKEKGWKCKQQLISPSKRALNGKANMKTGSARTLKSSCVWGIFIKKEKAQEAGKTP